MGDNISAIEQTCSGLADVKIRLWTKTQENNLLRFSIPLYTGDLRGGVAGLWLRSYANYTCRSLSGLHVVLLPWSFIFSPSHPHLYRRYFVQSREKWQLAIEISFSVSCTHSNSFFILVVYMIESLYEVLRI